MKSVWLPLGLVVVVALLAWTLLAGDRDPRAALRQALRAGAVEEQRTALRQVTTSRDLPLLPDVARCWERVFSVEGFQRQHFPQGSLQPQIHECFEALGVPAAEQLVGWAEEAPLRFVPCLVAAGVALRGAHGAEVGPGRQIGGVQVRAYHFRWDSTTLTVPTIYDADWYGRIEETRKWRAFVDQRRREPLDR